jgi:hypothetical protein
MTKTGACRTPLIRRGNWRIPGVTRANVETMARHLIDQHWGCNHPHRQGARWVRWRAERH